MEQLNQFVEFDQWCSKCKHEKLPERDDPCFECLENPVNYATTKPVKWEEKEQNDKRR